MEAINMDSVNLARRAKIEKLKIWSNIQNLENI
jgi:predicted peroxiredoxin